jgi:hypothetical protein
MYAFGDELEKLEYPNLRRRNQEYKVNLELKNSYHQEQENYPFQALNVFLRKHIMLRDNKLIVIKRFVLKDVLLKIFFFRDIYDSSKVTPIRDTDLEIVDGTRFTVTRARAGNVLISERTTAILRRDSLYNEWRSGGASDQKVFVMTLGFFFKCKFY